MVRDGSHAVRIGPTPQDIESEFGVSININQTIFLSAVVPFGAAATPAVGGLGRFAVFAGIVLGAGLVGLSAMQRRRVT